MRGSSAEGPAPQVESFTVVFGSARSKDKDGHGDPECDGNGHQEMPVGSNAANVESSGEDGLGDAGCGADDCGTDGRGAYEGGALSTV